MRELEYQIYIRRRVTTMDSVTNIAICDAVRELVPVPVHRLIPSRIVILQRLDQVMNVFEQMEVKNEN